MPNYGAAQADWDHFSLILGLTEDLLPVVSNPTAKISPESTMGGIGKTPSRYNGSKHVVGFAKWTQHVATQAEVETWRKQPDYGICLQTRSVRAIDIDVEDSAIATRIVETIATALPIRFRENSAKCLMIFALPGDMPKRVIRLEEGIIEFLATGQQFVACGTHTSGQPYKWRTPDGRYKLPDDIPTLTLEEFEAIWSKLASAFGKGDTITSASPSRTKVLAEALSNDKVAQYLIDNGWVKQPTREGSLHITCPFEAEHSGPSAISATTYFPPNTGGYAQGHFKCLHAHCEHRSDDEFKHAVGMPYDDPFDDFDVVDTIVDATGDTIVDKAPTKRFTVVPAEQFSEGKPAEWIVKGVIPEAELVVVFGESGSGKSFFITDIALAIAQGTTWRGHRVKQGNVVYVAAEGASGLRNRLRALSIDSGVPLSGLGIGVIADAPNFMQVQDVKDVIHAVKAYGPTSLVIVDTFAQVMAGSNENAGEDVGKALAHCRQLHRHTGATVVLIHHAGKDSSKGARGWSGLRAAADAEIEVSRCDDDRVATITKMKDGVDGLEFGFKLKTVLLCKDLDDEDVTSCVLEHVEGARRINTDKKAKIGSNERLVLKTLGDMVAVGEASVPYEAFVNAVIAQMLPTGARDRRREMVLAAINKLRDRGEVSYENGFMTFPEGEEI